MGTRSPTTKVLCLLAAFTLLAGGCARFRAVPTDGATERAILDGDWQKILDCVNAWSARDPKDPTPTYLRVDCLEVLHRKVEERRGRAVERSFTHRDWQRHQSWVEALTKRHPESARVWQIAAMEYTSRPTERQQAADRAVELGPNDPWSFVIRSWSELDRPEDAIRDCDRALAVDPRQPDAFRLRASAYQSEGNMKRAVEDLNRAVELLPRWPEALLARSSLRLAVGDQQGAMDDLNGALDLDPEYAEAYRQRGLTESAVGQPAAALRDLDRAIQARPDYGEALADRAKMEAGAGRTDSAARDATVAISLLAHMQTGGGYEALGEAHTIVHDYRAAIDDYTHAIAMCPTDANAYCYRGEAHYSLGEMDQAAQDAGAAIRFNDRFAEAYTLRAYVHWRRGDLPNAVADATRSIEFGSGLPQAYCTRALLFAGEGKRQEAQKDLDAAARIAPEYTKAFLLANGQALRAQHLWPHGLEEAAPGK
jgi:tetratricopeptide (TPR) repeat protein